MKKKNYFSFAFIMSLQLNHEYLLLHNQLLFHVLYTFYISYCIIIFLAVVFVSIQDVLLCGFENMNWVVCVCVCVCLLWE